MYKNNLYVPEINIDLDNGIYAIDTESAIGKTWLCNCLKKLKTYGEPVDAYTYSDKLNGVDISSVLVPNKNKVVLLDRYDMYNGYGKELLGSCEDNTIVLIDCKSPFTVFRENKWCEIDIGEGYIEVS